MGRSWAGRARVLVGMRMEKDSFTSFTSLVREVVKSPPVMVNLVVMQKKAGRTVEGGQKCQWDAGTEVLRGLGDVGLV